MVTILGRFWRWLCCDECIKHLEALRGLVASVEMSGVWSTDDEAAAEILAEVDAFLEER